MTRTIRKQIINGIVLGGILTIGIMVGYCAQPAPVVQEIRGAVRYVPIEVITEREPDAEVGKFEGIAKPVVKPDYVAHAPGGAWLDVEDFSAYSRALERGDTAKAELTPRRLLTRSVRTDDGFLFAKDKITIVSVLSDGTLDERRYSAHDGWQFRADADSLVFQHPRFPVKKTVEVGVVFGLGLFAGFLIF